ncbi:type II toxin-antitoxin system RelE/ParE family toxin, partial [Chryseobacterium gambrini]
MIHSFKDARLENLFRQGKHQAGLPTEITESIISRLAVIHSATTVKDLTSNSLRYEKLPMTRNKYSSVRVN